MYEAHFGFADMPFRVAPDPRFYVDAAPHRMAIRALLDGLERDEEFVPLIGDFGSGKTTVARRMLEEADPARHLTAELPRLRVEGDDLLERTAEALGMNRTEAAPGVGSLIHRLEALARDGRDALLLVDEAQRLGIDALDRLRALTAVRVDGRAALHVFLVGCSTPAGLEELERVGRPLDIGAPVRVEPLDAIGTHDYILERLGRAGWTGRPAFDMRTTAEIHVRCRGNPARINRLCGDILLQLYMDGRHDVDADVVRAVDESLQSEPKGEPAALALPSFAPASRRSDSFMEALSAKTGDLDLDIEIPVASPIAVNLPVPRLADIRLAVPDLPASFIVRGGRPRRGGLRRAAGAVGLLISGGVLWQTISGVAAAYSEQTRLAAAAAAFQGNATQAAARDAAPSRTVPAGATASTPQAALTTLPKPAAAEIVAQAEQAIAQAPPGAGPTPSAAVVLAGTPEPPHAAGIDRHGALPRRALPAEGGSIRPTMRAAAPAPTMTATCTRDGETLGLCERSPARETARAAVPEPRLAPQGEPAPEPVRAPTPPPACDPVRAALALCPEHPRTAP